MSDNLSMTRRTMLSATAAGVGAAAIGATPAMAQARKTFVLVHGAWHGGWCWRRVSDLLEAKGHKVFAPTLTGLADRSHLLSKEVDPRHPHRRHRQPVQVGGHQGRLLRRALLRRMAGLRRAGADRRPRVVDRVGRRVQAGERPARRRLRLRVQPQGAGGRGREGRARRGRRRRPRRSMSTRRIAPGSNSKTTPQPNGVALQPIKLTGARDKVAKKTYIRARNIRSPRSTRPTPSARPTRPGRPSRPPPPATTSWSTIRPG